MSSLEVKVKKLSTEAKMPIAANPGDAGLDLVAVSKKLTREGFLEFGTGLAFSIPENHVGLLFPRSSISKKKMTLCNAVGVLDSGFRGEVTFRFKPATAGNGSYEVGDKIGQLVVMPYPDIELVEVDELDETVRGEGGWGSTGT